MHTAVGSTGGATGMMSGGGGAAPPHHHYPHRHHAVAAMAQVSLYGGRPLPPSSVGGENFPLPTHHHHHQGAPDLRAKVCMVVRSNEVCMVVRSHDVYGG